MAELIAGVLLALAVGTEMPARLRSAVRVVGALAFVAVLGAFVMVDLATGALYRGGFWLMALASVSLIAGAMVDGPMRQMLSWRPLTVLGLFSYGIYLSHWPLFLWLDTERTGLDGWALTVCGSRDGPRGAGPTVWLGARSVRAVRRTAAGPSALRRRSSFSVERGWLRRNQTNEPLPGKPQPSSFRSSPSPPPPPRL